MTPSPTTTGNPTLDKIRAGQYDDPQVQRAFEIARQNGIMPPMGGQSQGEQPSAPKPIAAPDAPPAPTDATNGSIRPLAGIPAAPQPSANQRELRRLETSPSGIGQIKHAGIRIPLQIADAIGSAFVPSLTAALPGTEFHHQRLLRETGENVNQEQSEATAEAQRQHLGAETQNQLAEAEARRHPQPKEKPIGSVTTVNGKVMQFNPATDRYDIEVGSAEKGRPEGLVEDKAGNFIGWTDAEGKHHSLDEPGTPQAIKAIAAAAKPAPHNETPFDVWRKKHPDADPEEWLKLEAGAKPVAPNEYADFKAGYLTKHPGASGDDIVKAYAAEHKAPVDHGQNFIDPATNTLVRVSPGQQAPKGAMTATQAGSVNTPTTQMRNVGAQAQLVHEQTPHMLAELDRLKDSLGPLMGRWNEFMQGRVGMDNPEFAGLRADLLMYSSAVALMHARGRLPENLRAEFEHAINNPKQSPENLKAVISRIDDWTGKNMNAMGGASHESNEPTLDEINAEVERRKKAGKK